MSSAIIELQQAALDRTVRVSDLLRRALVVARKLGLLEFLQWIETELNGHGDSAAPDYRQVIGEPRGWNPYRGWQPIGFESTEERESFSRRKCGQSIAELESLLESPDRTFQMPFPTDITLRFGGMQERTKGSVFVSRSALVGIIDAVRTIVLNWALKLEEEGVLGEGLTFSSVEREAASRSPQNITIFSGAVQSAQVQQGVEHGVQVSIPPIDPAQVRAFLKSFRSALPDLGLAQQAHQEASAEMRTIEAQLESPRPKHPIVREGLRSIRAILEGVAGGAGAQLLLELAKLI